MTNLDPRSLQTEELERLTEELRTLKMSIADATVQSRQLEADLEKEQQQEAALRQEFEKTQAEMSSLSILRFGKKIAARNAAENLTKQLTACMQRQVTLMQRQEDCRERLAELNAQLPGLETAVRSARQLPESISSPEPSTPASPAMDEKPLLARLEALYPHRQVFAPASICPRLWEQLTFLAAGSGESPADFLSARGWQLLNGQQARELRHGDPIEPGCEPESIRPRVNRLLARLEKHYPDHVIRRSLQQDHKGLAQDVSGLSLYLGYPSAAAMLAAYGFTYQAASGRPATESATVLDALAYAIAGKPKPRTVTQLIAEHPEFARQIKTLQNQAPARFGCTLRQHLLHLGILAERHSS